jgi:hypothetical protein
MLPGYASGAHGRAGATARKRCGSDRQAGHRVRRPEILVAMGEDLDLERLQHTPLHAISKPHRIVMHHDEYFQDPEDKRFRILTFQNVTSGEERIKMASAA